MIEPNQINSFKGEKVTFVEKMETFAWFLFFFTSIDMAKRWRQRAHVGNGQITAHVCAGCSSLRRFVVDYEMTDMDPSSFSALTLYDHNQMNVFLKRISELRVHKVQKTLLT